MMPPIHWREIGERLWRLWTQLAVNEKGHPYRSFDLLVYFEHTENYTSVRTVMFICNSLTVPV